MLSDTNSSGKLLDGGGRLPLREEHQNACSEDVSVKIADITGNIPPVKGSIVATIVAEYEVQVTKTYCMTEYRRRLIAWLLRAHRAALCDPATPPSLHNQQRTICCTTLRYIGGSAYIGADCAEVADAERVLDRHYLSLAEPLHAEKAKILEQRRNEGKEHVLTALTAMVAAFDTTAADLLELEEQLDAGNHGL